MVLGVRLRYLHAGFYHFLPFFWKFDSKWIIWIIVDIIEDLVSVVTFEGEI